jgi:hypothetical protein
MTPGIQSLGLDMGSTDSTITRVKPQFDGTKLTDTQSQTPLLLQGTQSYDLYLRTMMTTCGSMQCWIVAILTK